MPQYGVPPDKHRREKAFMITLAILHVNKDKDFHPNVTIKSTTGTQKNLTLKFLNI